MAGGPVGPSLREPAASETTGWVPLEHMEPTGDLPGLETLPGLSGLVAQGVWWLSPITLLVRVDWRRRMVAISMSGATGGGRVYGPWFGLRPPTFSRKGSDTATPRTVRYRAGPRPQWGAGVGNDPGLPDHHASPQRASWFRLLPMRATWRVPSSSILHATAYGRCSRPVYAVQSQPPSGEPSRSPSCAICPMYSRPAMDRLPHGPLPLPVLAHQSLVIRSGQGNRLRPLPEFRTCAPCVLSQTDLRDRTQPRDRTLCS